MPGSEALTAYQNGPLVLVRWANTTLAGYRAAPSQKYPYFGPLAGPASGLSLTTESSLPYPHHRGLWLGCEPLNGGDFWADNSLDRGHIRSLGPKLEMLPNDPRAVIIRDYCRWERPGTTIPPALDDMRTFTLRVIDDRTRVLDAEFALTALTNVTIGKAKHSFFALRCAPDLSPMYGGTLVNSEGGIGAAGTYGKPAAWCGYYGKRSGHGPVEGIAIMDHPRNPWSPSPWLTRDYGHLSPSPFNFRSRPWTLPEGESIRLRYRVVLHAGDPKEASLDRLYKEWAESSLTGIGPAAHPAG